MLHKLRNHPLFASFLIIILYAAWFIIPVFFTTLDSNSEGLSDITNLIYQWETQVVITLALIIILTFLKWWRVIGFTHTYKGGLKFLIPPLLFLTILFVMALTVDKGDTWFLGFTSLKQLLTFLLILFMLGFTEEAIFRGILFHGLETKFTPLTTVILSALIFGLFHYINMFIGADFYATTYQVVHAAAAGFMYATLRLRIGAIWPVMLFHSIWDIGLVIISSIQHSSTEATQTNSSFSVIYALLLIFPALAYGIFVYWRWSLWSNKN